MSRGVLGAVLAGGGSRRMGRDKALLPVAGRPLVARAVRVLRGVLDEVVVAARSAADYPGLEVEVLGDLRPGGGPLAGIETALGRAARRPILALACDLPRVSVDLVRFLLETAEADARPGPAVWYPFLGATRQPLCGVYSAACLPMIERQLTAGSRSVAALLDHCDAVALELHPALPFYRPDLLLNLNAPADVDRLSEIGLQA